MADDLLIRIRLQYDDEFALKCLMILHEKQEADEQDAHDAMHRNGVGFNKQDAPVLTTLAVEYQHLSAKLHRDKDMNKLHELLPKYAKQLSRYLTDEEVENG